MFIACRHRRDRRLSECSELRGTQRGEKMGVEENVDNENYACKRLRYTSALRLEETGESLYPCHTATTELR